MAKNTATNATVSMSDVRKFAIREGLDYSTPSSLAEAKALLVASLAGPADAAKKSARKPSEMKSYSVLVIIGNLADGPCTVELCGSAISKRGKQTDATPITPFLDFAALRVAECEENGETASILTVRSSDLGLSDDGDDAHTEASADDDSSEA
jgi:hypothetical protein